MGLLSMEFYIAQDNIKTQNRLLFELKRHCLHCCDLVESLSASSLHKHQHCSPGLGSSPSIFGFLTPAIWLLPFLSDHRTTPNHSKLTLTETIQGDSMAISWYSITRILHGSPPLLQPHSQSKCGIQCSGLDFCLSCITFRARTVDAW